MALGPIELAVIGFPGTPSSGAIAAEIEKLIDDDVITLVDALFVAKGHDGDVTFIEVEQVDVDSSIQALASLLDESDGLLADEDVDAIADALEPGASALMLVFENTWVKPLRDAVLAADGELLAHIRVPGLVVEEVLAELSAS